MLLFLLGGQIMKDISIYIHIPFCESKCHYCDFLSFENKLNNLNIYVNSLCKEIQTYKNNLTNSNVKTIFFGGGTPSILTSQQFEKIFKNLKDIVDIGKDVEFTVECNPNSITAEKLKLFRKYGVNRLSIGLQAWQNDMLKFLGRVHNQSDFENAIFLAKENEFNNINVDIMFGIPNQTIDMLVETLDKVIEKGITHISCYSLMLEEGTCLYSKRESNEITMLPEEVERNMYHYICRYLSQKGFNHYEISNFAKLGYESKHNIVYWDAKEYIGFGLGAHSYLSCERYHNATDLEQYIKEGESSSFSKCDIETLDITNQYEEYMFLGLRKMAGIDMLDFKNRFNVDVMNIYGDKIIQLLEDELLERIDNVIRLTPRGIDVSNVVFGEFIL